MERLSVNQKKSPRCNKAKKKPMKVVYISNPVKFTTSASEFRALVQELTGQYSDVADNTDDKYPAVIDEPRLAEVSEPVAYNSVAAGASFHLDMLNEVLGAHIMQSAAPDLMPPFYFHDEFQRDWLYNINEV